MERLFSNLSPCPPSLSKGRGSISKREVKLLSINLFPLSFEGEGDIKGVRLVNTLECRQLKEMMIVGIIFMFMVSVAQWLRRQVVALEIVGSNPTVHPS
jgi:hypothetical protein